MSLFTESFAENTDVSTYQADFGDISFLHGKHILWNERPIIKDTFMWWQLTSYKNSDGILQTYLAWL